LDEVKRRSDARTKEQAVYDPEQQHSRWMRDGIEDRGAEKPMAPVAIERRRVGTFSV
jgi:hypothetical protein